MENGKRTFSARQKSHISENLAIELRHGRLARSRVSDKHFVERIIDHLLFLQLALVIELDGVKQ